MINGVFAVYDDKARAFLPVFTARTPAVASRMLKAMVDDGQSDFARNVEDYALYQVGEFDDDDGELKPVEGPPVLICRATALKGNGNV